MSIQAGVGHSYHRNPRVAGRDAVQMALEKAGIDKPDFTFMFATVGYNQSVALKAVREAIQFTPLVGCSAEGIITGDETNESNFSIVVMTIKSDKVNFQHGHAIGLSKDSHKVGVDIAETLQSYISEDALSLFLFPDGITVNYDALEAGLTDGLTLRNHLPLVGGAAGDNWKFDQTYQYCDDQVFTDGVSWGLMSGIADLAWGVSHGCVPVGVEHKITHAEKNVIYEIDNIPALDIIKNDYLSPEDMLDWAKTFQTFTLGFKAPGHIADYDQYIIRTMVGGINETNGSIALATEVEDGDSIWVARRDFEKLKEGINRTVTEIKGQNENKTPKLAFQFECIGRGKVFLFDEQKHELLHHLRDQIGTEVPWIGFYTYGEIGPIGEENCFHNDSMVFMTVS